MEVNAQGAHECCWPSGKWATDTYRTDPIHIGLMCIALKDDEHTYTATSDQSTERDHFSLNNSCTTLTQLL